MSDSEKMQLNLNSRIFFHSAKELETMSTNKKQETATNITTAKQAKQLTGKGTAFPCRLRSHFANYHVHTVNCSRIKLQPLHILLVFLQPCELSRGQNVGAVLDDVLLLACMVIC